MKRTLFLVAAFTLALAATFAERSRGDEPQAPLNLDDRRELFIDDYLVDKLDSVELIVHRPERKNVEFIFDRPWEGSGEGYASVFKANGKFYMTYRSWGIFSEDFPMKYALLESDDGIHWTRPELGLCEFRGSKQNNILVDKIGDTELGVQDFTPFFDENPDCPPDERYKAISSGYGAWDGKGPHGLFAWKSPDGIRWSLMQDAPVYTDGKFDTQNIAFWSVTEKKYVLYFRVFRNEVRVVDRAVSDDFIHWKYEGEIQFPKGGGPSLREQFYTNQIQQYYRAPHIYIGLPTRYVDNGMTASTPLLPEWDLRQFRMRVYKGGERLGTATTDVMLISSRDGMNFTRANDVFIAPGLRTRSNWFYGDNYTAWNFLETNSEDDDSPNEISIFTIESSCSDKPAQIRRYALRVDGFGSIHAKTQEGEALTKPLRFTGDELSLNVATSSAGFVKVEVLDENANVVPHYSLDDCDLIYGDSIDRRVTWKGNADMKALEGKTIRLRFRMYEADIYSLKWENKKKD